MKNFKLTAIPGDTEDKIHPAIEISFTTHKKKVFAKIYADNTITFNPELDYSFDELEYFLRIGNMFYTFYNNLKTN